MAYRVTKRITGPAGTSTILRDKELPESAGQWLIRVPAFQPSEREQFAPTAPEAERIANDWATGKVTG